jgi:hypothetical protein
MSSRIDAVVSERRRQANAYAVYAEHYDGIAERSQSAEEKRESLVLADHYRGLVTHLEASASRLEAAV